MEWAVLILNTADPILKARHPFYKGIYRLYWLDGECRLNEPASPCSSFEQANLNLLDINRRMLPNHPTFLREMPRWKMRIPGRREKKRTGLPCCMRLLISNNGRKFNNHLNYYQFKIHNTQDRPCVSSNLSNAHMVSIKMHEQVGYRGPIWTTAS